MTETNPAASASPASERGFSIDGHTYPGRPIEPALYPVATPIGNLSDIGLRALEVLAAADIVACEDTRVSRVLFERYGIRRSLVAYHEHNAARERPRLLAALADGRSVALISDAGTPLISDPGYKLVDEALAAGHKVVPVPGPSAVLAAIVAAGLPTDSFLFGGFLPSRAGQRRARLAAFAELPATLVFYESPHRVAESLADMAAILGPGRPGALARELTKRFEEVRRGSLAVLAEGAAADAPRGEIVLLAGPPGERSAAAEDIDALLRDALARLPVGRAAAEVAEATGEPRKELYARARMLKALADAEGGEGANPPAETAGVDDDRGDDQGGEGGDEGGEEGGRDSGPDATDASGSPPRRPRGRRR